MIALDTPEGLAVDLFKASAHPSMTPREIGLMQGAACKAIAARDEQIASWCEERAAEARQKADGESLNASLVMSGEADAYLTIAAMLLGSR